MKASTSFAKVVSFAKKANGAQEALDDVSPAPRAPCRSLEARLSPTASVNPGSWEPQVSLALPANRESTSKGAIASIVLKGRRHGRGAHHERVVSRCVRQARTDLTGVLVRCAKRVRTSQPVDQDVAWPVEQTPFPPKGVTSCRTAFVKRAILLMVMARIALDANPARIRKCRVRPTATRASQAHIRELQLLHHLKRAGVVL
jgi:hypothetical protein